MMTSSTTAVASLRQKTFMGQRRHSQEDGGEEAWSTRRGRVDLVALNSFLIEQIKGAASTHDLCFHELMFATDHAHILYADRMSDNNSKLVVLFPQRQCQSEYNGKNRTYIRAVLVLVGIGQSPKRLDCSHEVKYKDYETAVNCACRHLLGKLSEGVQTRFEEIPKC